MGKYKKEDFEIWVPLKVIEKQIEEMLNEASNKSTIEFNIIQPVLTTVKGILRRTPWTEGGVSKKTKKNAFESMSLL